MISDWRMRLRALFRRSRLEEELDEELRFHFDRQVAAYRANGIERDEAIRLARLGFGSLDAIKEEHRDARGTRLLEDAFRDVHHGVRQLWRSPGFTLAAVLCLGIGIGASTAIYSIVDTILFRPLPFPESERLVNLVEHYPSPVPGGPILERGITYDEFLEWRARSVTWSDSLAMAGMAQRLVRTPDGVVSLWGAVTSPNAFAMLGATMVLGRTLDESDRRSTDVAILSFAAWRQYFGGEPGILGRAIALNPGLGQNADPALVLTVVGVLSPDFEFPTGAADLYTPIPLTRGDGRSPRVRVLARLAPGVALAAATDEVNELGAASRPPWPADAPSLATPRFELQPMKELATRDVKPAMRVFLGAVVAVMLLVCATIANLLLARGLAQRREMAVRLALGASRGRLARQVMTECLLLAIAGGALGALVGAAGVSVVKQLAHVDAPGIFRLMFGATALPRMQEVRVDLSILGIAIAWAAGSCVMFGVVPVWYLSRIDAVTGLRASGGRVAASGARPRAILVATQVGLATVLLVVAGLLLHSFVRLVRTDRGYDASNVLALQLILPSQYSAVRKGEAIETLLTRFRGLPGVHAAGFSRHGVLIGEELTIGDFVAPGRSLDQVRLDPVRARVRSVSGGFLTAIGGHLLAGRDLCEADRAGGPVAIVVNRSAAQRYFDTPLPVGQVVSWHIGETSVPAIVVGVVEDIRQESLAQDTFPEIFVDYRRFLDVLAASPALARHENEWAIGFLSFAIRTDDLSSSALAAIRRTVGDTDPNAGIDALVPLSRLVASSTARQRLAAVVVGVFALGAGLLAVLGIYSVLAYLVVQRTQEIGIRLALGARRGQVLALVMRTGLVMTATGIVAGLLSAAAVTRFLRTMLYGITPLDVSTFVAVAVLFSAAAALAAYLPARRAASVDPVAALRSE